MSLENCDFHALQQLVDSDVWKDFPAIAGNIYNRFCQLNSGSECANNFGRPDFWYAVSQLLPPTVQVGHGEEDDDDQGEVVTITASDYYELKPMFQKSSKRFGSNYGQYDLIFKNMENAGDLDLVLLAVFSEVLSTIKDGGNGNDLLSCFIDHEVLDIPIVIDLRPQEAMTAEVLTAKICSVQQSKKEMTFDKKLTLYFTRIRCPAGNGRHYLKRKYNTNLKVYSTKKHSIVEIVNNDNLCCARAIVVGKSRIDDDRYATVRKGDRNGGTLQRLRAKSLMAQAGLANHNGSCGIEEFKALQQALDPAKYQLKVFDKDVFDANIYHGPVDLDESRVINLWLHDSHFDLITPMTGFLEKAYYCGKCMKGYSNKTDHRICPVRCSACLGSGKCLVVRPLLMCGKCHRFFNNAQCFGKHLRKGTKGFLSTCDLLHRCETCRQEFYPRKGHQCGVRKCSICKLDVSSAEHQCYIQPYCSKLVDQEASEDPLAEVQELPDSDDEETEEPCTKKSKKPSRTVFIVYDMECRQDEKIETNENGDINRHVPDLIIAHKVCSECCSLSPSLDPCTLCKEKHHTFIGDGCLDKFCEWIFSEENKKAIAIAHNGKAYDAQFILQYCHQKGCKPKKIISRGLSIMYLEVNDIQFKDSLNFLPMSLAALGRAFNIEECQKGYFPHMFNRKENWDYNGDWPDVEYYQPQYMTAGERAKFMVWYDQQRGKQFNFQEQLLSYCESDVTLLRLCCLKFRQMFMEISNIDPLVESITIASACNKLYRMHHMPINRIGVVPHGGYRKNERQSIIALKWLKWLAWSTGENIRHKLNGGEVRIPPWRVDGLCGQKVFEFYGCFWHGCPQCMPKRRRITADGVMTAAEAYQRTAERRRALESQGYTLTEKWECELYAELKQNEEMATFFTKTEIMDPMDPREAFYGGRTNATVLYHKVANGEKISYIDVLSLYPFICKYGRFPTGHPKVLTENFEQIDKYRMPYEGLVKCKILPPTDLLHPVLPFRCKESKKLMFPLCQTCCSRKQQDKCCHTDEERALVGTWVTMELQKALELGRRILEVFEVWHYEETEQYDQDSNEGGLFAGYINEFLRIKQESDGWPMDCDSDEKKQAFIEEWKRRENILLRQVNMLKNNGLRALAKIILNSFWGKFGQRSQQSKMEYINDPAAFFKLVFDPSVTAKTVRFVNDQMVAVTYDVQDEFVEVLGNTNVVIAAYTTAQARLKLYSYIEELQDRVLYFDTDSIIYLTRPADLYHPPVGSYLGEMTDELEKEYGTGSYITEFVSGGPKHYAYKVWSTNAQQEKTCIKVKGFKINHAVSAEINFTTLKKKVHDFVKDQKRSETMIKIQRIERTFNREIVTVTRQKVHRVTYDKRVVLPDFTSRPYGFV